MTNREKVAYHLAKVEKEQAWIDRREAEELALKKNHRRPRYAAKAALKDDFEYNRAVGTRDGHMRAVSMYALAVLAGVE